MPNQGDPLELLYEDADPKLSTTHASNHLVRQLQSEQQAVVPKLAARAPAPRLGESLIQPSFEARSDTCSVTTQKNVRPKVNIIIIQYP